MDAQDAQDNQYGRLLHKKLTPVMIACGRADVQDQDRTVFRKILCTLCIHVNRKSAPLRVLPNAHSYWCSLVSIGGSSFSLDSDKVDRNTRTSPSRDWPSIASNSRT